MMEKKFYADNFEQFLKETTDDFRMYPLKKVWNSLYNDLHPGRKWPSLAVCLLLLCSILFIGVSNEIKTTALSNSINKGVSQGLIESQRKIAVTDIPGKALTTRLPGDQKKPSVMDQKQGYKAVKIFNINTHNVQSEKNAVNKEYFSGDVITADTKLKINNTGIFPTDKGINNVMIDDAVATSDKNLQSTFEKPVKTILPQVDGKILVDLLPSGKNVPAEKKLAPVKHNKTTTDKEWIDDYAFHNQPTPSIKSKLNYQVYLTPSIGYRKLFTNTIDYQSTARPSQPSTTSVPVVNKSLDHHPAFNLEAGYNLLYSYSKSIRLKGGFQINYTNYNIRAYDLGHSILTNLLLNDPNSAGIELSPRSSTLGNVAGPGIEKMLKSNTLQVSLPLGADFKLAGKHNVQWFVGTTVQPTYVVFGNAYLVSSDLKYYVYDASFLRKWNLNAAVETFISYKAKNGISFNAGPQFRYQFFSTYDRKYSYTEKLYNLGVKLGMTRNF